MAYGQKEWPFNMKDKPVDTDKISVEGPKPAPAGLYEGKIASATPKVTEKGKPAIEARVELIGSDDDRIRDEGKGKLVWDTWMLDESGFRTKNLCKVLDVDFPDYRDAEAVEEFCTRVVGQVVPVMVKHKAPYNGTVRAGVEYFGTEPPVDESNGKGRQRGNAGRRR